MLPAPDLRSEGIGKRNAWQLTTHGEEIARMLPEIA